MDVSVWQFSNCPPNSDSVADAMTFLIMLHSTCTGPFSGGIACIRVFDFVPRKQTHLLCFVTLVMICRMHPNICGESFHFFCILLLCLYVLRGICVAVLIVGFFCTDSSEFITINIVWYMALS